MPSNCQHNSTCCECAALIADLQQQLADAQTDAAEWELDNVTLTAERDSFRQQLAEREGEAKRLATERDGVRQALMGDSACGNLVPYVASIVAQLNAADADNKTLREQVEKLEEAIGGNGIPEVIEGLLVGEKALASAKCEHCDPSVGYTCECCHSAHFMGRAARILSSARSALSPSPPAGEQGQGDGWVSVGGELPSGGRQVLVSCRQGEHVWQTIGFLCVDGKWHGHDALSVTHWRPLPAPPAQAEAPAPTEGASNG